jgi:uracil-DNA glycosylase
MPEINVQIEESWKRVLAKEFSKPYFINMRSFLKEEKLNDKVIFPPGPDIFKAFDITPFDELKVVIIGQDPYHNPNEAMGLCFSVPNGIKVPPSLVNIFKEIKRDLGYSIPSSGDLTSWGKQGVLLLNAMLSVEKNKPGSHKKIGWQDFTDAVIKKISDEKSGVIFLLWGNFAKGKAKLIDVEKHYILESVHPSPLAGNKFQGNGHFSKTNELLKLQNKSPINWEIK